MGSLAPDEFYEETLDENKLEGIVKDILSVLGATNGSKEIKKPRGVIIRDLKSRVIANIDRHKLKKEETLYIRNRLSGIINVYYNLEVLSKEISNKVDNIIAVKYPQKNVR